MIDPRPYGIEKRISNVKSVIAVSGGKGGVGKSLVASLLTLFLCERNERVGLLDLDFYGPSTHVILGINGVEIKEDMGIRPPKWRGISYMSVFLFTKGNPLPIRGKDASNILREILSVTLWEGLDYLVLDMPPGTGEIELDTLIFFKNVKFLLVTNPSKTAYEVLKKEIGLLRARNIPIIGVIENQRMESNSLEGVIDVDVPIIGSFPYEKELERSLGSPDSIMGTFLFSVAKSVFERIFPKDVH
jgi:ATP-binding protein involved in chromosome partitioning